MSTRSARPGYALLSTTRQLQQSPPRNEHDTQNPELPKFSFEGLGISKNMKLFLIGILGVLGTIETWFWCKAIWRWYNGEGFSLREARKQAKSDKA